MLNHKEYFKKILIVFWALWWLIALWTDVVGGLAHLGLLRASWAVDNNFPFLLQSLAMYPLPQWIPSVLFTGIILWSLLSTIAFIWACLALNRSANVWMRRADLAFILSLMFWLAFFLADQLVMKFDLEENHMVQGGFQLLSYLSLYCLPSRKE
ncbi:hypothetical protein [Legionella jordanis]|uniref:Transmembrane protein n=1 Tax=Legionella jordanis TaxID=456 RepID=A0A0W0VCV0_9GAMM|nr:hypothetical protein [Legionella jordanis]KTD17964.1 hypothetical protein Ljor_2270 [Legionella jordanis]VEH13944.1 Uncharacterised protein [Legionella jordanis]HAT8714323.1 hypothetical protein [Legionella jordanis]